MKPQKKSEKKLACDEGENTDAVMQYIQRKPEQGLWKCDSADDNDGVDAN